RVLLASNQPHESFRSSEFTKARIFAENLSRRSANLKFSLPPDVLKLDQELNDKVYALKINRRRALENDDKALVSNLEALLIEAEKNLANHVEMLRSRYPVYAATKYPLPMDVSQQSLEAGEYLISYEVSDTGIIAFLLNGKELVKSEFKPIKRSELATLVHKFRQPLEAIASGGGVKNALASFDFQTGKALYDLLLGNFLNLIPRGAPLIVVPDDCIGLVPFEALALTAGGAVSFEGSTIRVDGTDFLGDRNRLSYAQSATALTLARQAGKNKKIGQAALVIADPVFSMRDERAQSVKQREVASVDEDHYGGFMASIEDTSSWSLRFGRLAGTSILAENLSTLCGNNLVKLTGLQATKNNFLKTCANLEKSYRWIVIATHGFYGGGTRALGEPFLALTMVPPGTDGLLTMTDVMGLNLPCEVVALTACQTGLGTELSGEGVMSMGRAFQFAGAQSVLMSLWSVAEKSSVLLVENFLRYLDKGLPKLEALNMARQDVRKSGYDHPFFWASFILVGSRRNIG
ncbi:MAG: CHAT domain-containing protein, partial [Armatimonadota bacterium]